MRSSAAEYLYGGLGANFLDYPRLVSRGGTISVLWFRHGQDVKIPNSRVFHRGIYGREYHRTYETINRRRCIK